MAKTYASIDSTLGEWIARQPMFFVATAPLAADGHVNCSPKGGDTLRVLGEREVAYLDGAGSGIETIAHVRENGRIVVMLCAFDGSPRIVRLHGRAEVVDSTHADFAALLARFPSFPTVRAIVRVAVERISDSCGYGVPLMDFRANRRDMPQYLKKISDRGMVAYLQEHNQASIDGLPGLAPEALDGTVIRRD